MPASSAVEVGDVVAAVNGLGVNMQRLVIRLMALAAVPPNGSTPIQSAIQFLMDSKKVGDAARRAQDEARAMVALVRTACDPNPWRDADEEAIAGEIMRGVEARDVEQRARWKNPDDPVVVDGPGPMPMSETFPLPEPKR